MNRKKLIKVLAVLKKAAGGANDPSITQCVRVWATGKKLLLRTTDLATHATASVDGDCDSMSARMLHLGDLLKILRALKSVEVDFAATDAGVEIVAGSRKIQISSDRAPDDQPAWPKMGAELHTVALHSTELLSAMSYVSPATSEDYTRPQLCGMQWATDGLLIATDGHRLHSHHLSVGLGQAKTLPSGVVHFLIGALKLGGGVQVDTSGTNIEFTLTTGDGVEIVAACKEVEMEFPPYDQVVPNHQGAIYIDAEKLRSATKLAAAVHKKWKDGILFELQNGVLKVSTDAFSEVITLNRRSYATHKFAANPAYMLDTIAGFSGAVRVEFGEEELDPVLLRDAQKDRFAVVMPCRF